MLEVKFGERIRTVRKSAGYNQNEFCSLLNIPQSTLSAYETDRMPPTIATLINIATRFNVSLDWLCGIKNCISDKTLTALDEVILDEIADLNTLMSHLSKVLNRLEGIYKSLGVDRDL